MTGHDGHGKEAALVAASAPAPIPGRLGIGNVRDADRVLFPAGGEAATTRPTTGGLP
jgi:hypothetical protein